MAIKVFTKEYAGLLENVYEKNALFLETFGGKLQVKDGVADKNFLTLKVTDSEAVIQEYSTDDNVGFGTGTGKTTRFGNRKEIKAIDETVAYEAPLTIHEGVDSVTVNDNAEQVIEERTGIHAEAWTEKLNSLLAKALSDNANATVISGKLDEAGVKKAFAEAKKHFVNNKVTKRLTWRAYVTPEVYNVILESGLTTSAKKSSADIDNGEVKKFKGFVLVETPDEYFQNSENIFFAVDNAGQAGVGLDTYRIIDSEDFNGVSIQSVAKFGKYIPEKNKKAVYKAKLTATV
ncbi:capsid protein [Helcococcus bovis]|uniref:capsid protein n=1 Tax=Helcococcus bovis TaxID=3153252 RepID=UPI0038BC0320